MSKNMWVMISVIVALIVVIAGLAAMQSVNKQQQPQKNATILRVGFAWPTYIDPAIGSDYSSSTALVNLYDPLIFPTTQGTLKPWVAESWNVSTDGRIWTFHIRQGIKFHSGDKLTAQDVVFTFQRLLTIGKGFAYLYTPYIKNVTAVNDYTVKVILKKPYGPFPATLVRLYVVDKKVVMEHIKKPGSYGEYGDYGTHWLLTHDAGSGPYTVTQVVMEDHIYMKKFKEYWGPLEPNAPDEFEMLAMSQPATQQTLLTDRQLDISSQWLPEETIKALEKVNYLKVTSVPGGDEFYLMMNTKKTPTDDIHIRRALAYAFNYTEVVNEIFPGSKIARGPVPSYIPGWASDIKPCHQDLAKAKAELEKSKYWPDIKEHPDKYTIEFDWVAEVPAEEKVAILFAQDAAAIGLKVKVVKVPWLTMIQKLANMTTSPNIASVFVASNYPEAGSLLESKYLSKNAASWEQNEWLLNKTLDNMIEDALSTVNKTARFKKYAEIQHVIMQLCPDIFVLEHWMKFVYQDYIKWPAGEGKYTGVMGYDIDCRYIEVLSHS